MARACERARGALLLIAGLVLVGRGVQPLAARDARPISAGSAQELLGGSSEPESELSAEGRRGHTDREPSQGLPAGPLAVRGTVIVGILALIAGLGFFAWRRSASALAADLHRGMAGLEPEKLGLYLASEMSRLPAERAPAILDCLVARLISSDDQVEVGLGWLVEGSLPLIAMLAPGSGRSERGFQQAVADALEACSARLEEVAARLVDQTETAGMVAVARFIAREDHFYSRLLRAESLAHLSALRVDLAALEAETRSPLVSPFLDPDIIADLVEIFDLLDPLGRLPDVGDRALYLGQALTRTLAALDRLAGVLDSRPTLRLKIGFVVLREIRELLADAMKKIHRRAYLQITLNSRIVTTAREAMVVLEIENVGQGHARNVVVDLVPGDGFRPVRSRGEVSSLLCEQSARLEFLVEPSVSDRVRLRFSITYDDLERRGHHWEFADVVEFRHTGQHRIFKPLRPNPYVVGRPLLDSDVFIGRDEIFVRLEESLRGTHQDNVIVLMGSRRMGKTSILRRLRERLGNGYVPVLVDLQGMIGSGEAAFFGELATIVLDELEEQGIVLLEPPRGDFDLDPGSTFRWRFLKEVRAALGTRRLLLMFDEFEVLEARIRDRDLDPRILPYFRSLMQHETHISFVFSGTHRLDELTRDYWSGLLDQAIHLGVGHLSKQEVALLFEQPTADYFEIDPLALDKVFQLTGGHPHFGQLLARELVEFRNQQRLSYLTIQDVNAVAEQVAEKGQLHFSYLWEQGSREEQLLLLALKEMLDRKGLATLGVTQRYLNQSGLELCEPVDALRRLIRREIVEDNAGLLSFRIELLRLWLDRGHDLEKFRLSQDSGEATDGRESGSSLGHNPGLEDA